MSSCHGFNVEGSWVGTSTGEFQGGTRAGGGGVTRGSRGGGGGQHVLQGR